MYNLDVTVMTLAAFMFSVERVHHLTRGHKVCVLDDMDDRVIQCNAHRHIVMIQKINLNKHAWKTPLGNTAWKTCY